MAHVNIPKQEDGFAVVEALIAAVLVAVIASGAAELVVVGMRDTLETREHTTATFLAAQKLESLGGAAWGRIASDMTGLDTLSADVAGYSDVVVSSGLPPAAAGDAGAVFIRRWNVSPLPSNPTMGAVLRVLVRPVRRQHERSPMSRSTLQGDVLLESIRTAR